MVNPDPASAGHRTPQTRDKPGIIAGHVSVQ
jgi:hypothetical protein